MAWTKRTEGKYLVATETLTVSGTSNIYTSVIDFLTPGLDFTVLANLAATNTSNDADIDVYCCDRAAGTFGILKADLITSLNTKVAPGFYDISANGEAPYYKLALVPDGTLGTTHTVKMAVVQNTGGSQVV